jgi:mannonate dehydratase
MKLGLGLYRALLTEDNFQFARQAGVTHLVVHLVDYFAGSNPSLAGSADLERGWGITTNQDKPWSYDELAGIQRAIQLHGLAWEAIENLDPSHWYDVLLDGPQKGRQLENLKLLLRTMGKVGIPVLGYNFSIAGVWGWTKGPFGRGGAVSVGFNADKIELDTPIPNGMVWNMTYDPTAPPGSVPRVSDEELWQRLEDFLKAVVPVAEECGVRLAAHPDDPPVDRLRGAARLVNQPWKYQKLLDLVPSPSNGLEFCLGTMQEMREGDLYAAVDRYSRQGRIGYVHARNVRGKVPRYQEVFIDEGDIDMLRVLRILHGNGYDGVVIPDHTPEMTCAAPWHAGMAFALGYLRAAMQAVEREG